MQFVKYFELVSEVTMVHPTCKWKKPHKNRGIRKTAFRNKNHSLHTSSIQSEFPCNEELLNCTKPSAKATKKPTAKFHLVGLPPTVSQNERLSSSKNASLILPEELNPEGCHPPFITVQSSASPFSFLLGRWQKHFLQYIISRNTTYSSLSQTPWS